MNTAVPMVWRMGPKYGLQESSPPPGGLVGSDRGSGRASSTCRCAGSGTGRGAACSRCPASTFFTVESQALKPTLSRSVMVAPAAIADGAGVRPASMLAVAQAIAVTIIGMRRVVWLSLIPVFSFPCLHVLSRTGSDPTGRCGMVGVQRVESGDFHRGRPVFARLQTELACRFRRTADGEWSSSFPSTYMQNRLIPTFSRYLPKFLNKK